MYPYISIALLLASYDENNNSALSNTKSVEGYMNQNIGLNRNNNDEYSLNTVTTNKTNNSHSLFKNEQSKSKGKTSKSGSRNVKNINDNNNFFGSMSSILSSIL